MIHELGLKETLKISETGGGAKGMVGEDLFLFLFFLGGGRLCLGLPPVFS